MTAIVLADDDAALRAAIGASLRAGGHRVIEVADGPSCLVAVRAPGVAMVVLDLDLPGIGGLEVLRTVRAWSAVPIVVVAAGADPGARVAAFDAGADDYVAKPLDVLELEARIGVGLQRRPAPEPGPERVCFGDFELDRRDRALRRSGVDVALTPNELGLLETMAANPGRLLDHETLLKAVWGSNYGTETAYLRTYVSQLRRKLGDDAAHPTMIRTEPGLGYRWIAGR